MLSLVPMATLSFVATMLALTGAPANAKDKSSASGGFNPQKKYSGVVLQQGRTKYRCGGKRRRDRISGFS